MKPGQLICVLGLMALIAVERPAGQATGTSLWTLTAGAFLGGSDYDEGRALAVDASGNVYVGGWTYSSDFPTRGSAQGNRPDSRNGAAFVAKFDANGTLVFSRSVDGSIERLTVDRDRLLMAGNAAGGAFVGALSLDGSSLSYLLRLGANTSATALAVDAAGNVVLVGLANGELPVTHAVQSRRGLDFAAKIDSAGRLLFLTYLGGQSTAEATDVRFDQAGDIYIAGSVGADFPTTPGAFQRTLRDDHPCNNPYDNPCSDAFVMKLKADGSEIIYSTLIGGSSQDYGRRLVVDPFGRAYVVGWTTSRDFPQQNALSGQTAGQSGFVVRLNPDGSALEFSTYLGAVTTRADAVALDAAGQLYVAGSTSAIGFPVHKAWQPNNGGGPVFTGLVGSEIWQSRTVSLEYGGVSAMAVTATAPVAVYAASGHTVVRSNDGGSTWRSLPRLPEFSGVTQLEVDPRAAGVVYAVTSSSGIFKSVDGGSWVPINTGLTDTGAANGHAFAIAPSATSTLYFGTRSGYVFRSTDGGSTWAVRRSPTLLGGFQQSGAMIYALAVDPTNASILYINSGDVDLGGISKSTDGGATWTPRAAVSPRGGAFFANEIIVDPLAPSTLYAIGLKVYKSTDSGASWRGAEGLPEWLTGLALDRSAPGTLYAESLDGLYMSSDRGDSWTLVPYAPALNVFVVDPVRRGQLFGGRTSVGRDGFLAVIDPVALTIRASTYLGGRNDDAIADLAVTRDGSVMLTGVTGSPDFPVAGNATIYHQRSDAFLSVLAPNTDAAPRPRDR